MTLSFVKKEWFFFGSAVCIWATFLLVRYSGHEYFGQPLPTAGLEQQASFALRQDNLIQNTLLELIDNYKTEKNPTERMHVCHNIGTTYYDLYKSTQNRLYLDSAFAYTKRSIDEGGDSIARFHYNLGRIFTEFGAHEYARLAYEKAIQADPRHILALHNLGLLNYFEMKRSDVAQKYLIRALMVDSILPMCNLVLGLIDLDQKSYEAARFHLEKEIETDRQFAINPRKLPVSASQVKNALSINHYNLALLYSTRIVNQQKAQEHFHEYLATETDAKKRDDAIVQMGRYWQMGSGNGITKGK